MNYRSNEAGAEKVVAHCKASGVEAIAVQGDVAKDADCVGLVNSALDRFGRAEPLGRQGHRAAAIDEDAIVTRHRDLAHVLVGEQLVERPHAEGLLDHVALKRALLHAGRNDAVGERLLDQPAGGRFGARPQILVGIGAAAARGDLERGGQTRREIAHQLGEPAALNLVDGDTARGAPRGALA